MKYVGVFISLILWVGYEIIHQVDPFCQQQRGLFLIVMVGWSKPVGWVGESNKQDFPTTIIAHHRLPPPTHQQKRRFQENGGLVKKSHNGPNYAHATINLSRHHLAQPTLRFTRQMNFYHRGLIYQRPTPVHTDPDEHSDESLTTASRLPDPPNYVSRDCNECNQNAAHNPAHP